MTKLSASDVRHIAKLCRLELADDDVDRFAGQLSSILDYVDMLQEVDTKDVEVTAQVTGQTNGFREDDVVNDGPTTEELLECSPLPITERQIQTPSAHGPTKEFS